MRTTRFKDVFDRVVRLHGRDPRKLENSDISNAICDHINYRVRTICTAWLWPEWVITEERAFRPVWNSTEQYKRASDTDGLPDEVFYLGAAFTPASGFGAGYGYYRVKADAVTDPPIGNVPTDTTYWEAISPVDTFIDYDQRDRRPIGMVLGVFNQNPRVPTGNNNGHLAFNPSEKGIDVPGGNTTVFITNKMPAPVYTMTPYVVGKTYVRGQTVFDPVTGECFQAVTSTSNTPPGAGWVWIPFLDKWAGYVCNGAFADSLMEFDQGGGDIQTKMVLAQAANERADTQLQLEVDALTVQGQKLKWNFCGSGYSCCLETIPLGTSVTTLTDASQGDLGWGHSFAPPVAQGFFYYPWVMSLKTDAPTLIASVPTVNFNIGTIAKIFTGAEFRLDAGPSDPVGDPGQGDPADYALATNNKHWVQVM
jgi:hypothetical protein